MKLSCLMITTNVPNRLHLLDNAIMSVQSCDNNLNGLFDNKLLSIDVLPEHKFDLEYFKKYENLGWNIVYGRCSGHRGMLNNVIRGLDNITPGDYIYYVEDDVVITRLPDRASFEEFGKTNIGFACFNTHILSLDKPIEKPRVDYINNKANYRIFGNELFMIKSPIIKDEYYLNFPSAFIKEELFRAMIQYSSENIKGMGMEPGLTKSWFDLGFDKKYDVAVYVKPDTLSHLPMDLQRFYYMANMRFWNNDESLRHPSVNNRKNTIF